MPRRITFAPRDRPAAAALMAVPNVGPAMAFDLMRLGVRTPAALGRADAGRLYRRLERLDGRRPDPCVLDTFTAAVWCVRTGRDRPWWTFTPARKRAEARVRDQKR